MDEEMSKVYALCDEHNNILRIDGGYTMSNIDDVNRWVYLDEGYGDRYALCQSHYIDGEILEEHGIPLYKVEDGEVVHRPQEDIDEDIANLPVLPPQGDVWDEMAAAIKEGVAEV